MTRKEALIALRDAVREGNVVTAIDARNLWPEIGIWLECCKASQGSLDAAKALHEAVLPGWEWNLGPSNAKVNPYNGSPLKSWSGRADNPARAWLLAILEALIAEAPNDD